MSTNRKIGVSCLLLSSSAALSSFLLKGMLPYSGIIGWALAVAVTVIAPRTRRNIYFIHGNIPLKRRIMAIIFKLSTSILDEFHISIIK